MLVGLLICGLLINLLCLQLVWPRRQLKAARLFILVLLAQSGWQFGYVVELQATQLALARFWDSLQFAPYLVISPSWYLMTRALANRPIFKGLGHPAITLLMPIVVVIALFFDQQLQWIRLQGSETFSEGLFLYEYGPLMYLSVLWSYFLVFASIALLWQTQRHANAHQTRQILFIIAGIAIPVGLAIPSLFGAVYPGGIRDISPVAFALGNIIIVYELIKLHAFEYHLVDQISILGQLPVGALIFDHNDRLIEWNDLAHSMLGVEELNSGIPITELPCANILKQRTRGLWQRSEQWYELDYHRLTSHESFADLTPRMLIVQDITQLKRQQDSLQHHNEALTSMMHDIQRAQRQLIDSERHKTVVALIQSLAHEFNTPLGNLVTLLDSIKHDNNPEDYLPLIDKNISRVITLIQKLKGLTAVGAHNPLEQLNLKDAIQDAFQVKCKSLEEQYITHNLSVDPDIHLSAPRAAVEAVLVQLIDNSIRHAFKNIAAPCIEVQVQKQNSHIMLDFFDNGIGINPELQEHLFMPFNHGKNGLSFSQGLGLYSVHMWVTGTLKGQIECLSGSSASGAHFRLTLPLSIAD